MVKVFPSTDHDHLDEAVHRVCHPPDEGLLRERHRHAVLRLDALGGLRDFRVGRGALVAWRSCSFD